MAVPCPYCQLAIPMQSARPGKYATRCPDCGKKFRVTVPDDPGGRILVAPLKSELEPRAVETPRRPSEPTTPVGTRSEPPAPPLPADLLDFLRPPTGPENQTDAASSTRDRPGRIAGYRLLKRLGEGGLGPVYLARQWALDRPVALRVIKPHLAHNAPFMARLTREAYAAALLVHPHIAQLYDFGEDRGRSYLSMEFVDGISLGAILKKRKGLEVDQACCLVLQAARGLKFAHEQGMIHGNLKPDNLLINRQGLLKVADLGRVKLPETVERAPRTEPGPAVAPPSQTALGAVRPVSSDTLADTARGTPAFMASEQTMNATAVDARADIHALGCTFFMLVTGRPPFEDRPAPLDPVSRQAPEPVVPPETWNPAIPAPISSVMLRMISAQPADRYASMDGVIRDLEDALASKRSRPLTLGESEARPLLDAVNAYHGAPLAKRRSTVLWSLAAAWTALVLLGLVIRWPLVAGGLFGLGLMTALAWFVLDGLTRRSVLFLRLRALLFSNRLGDWLMFVAGLALLLVLLIVFRLLGAWLAFAGFAVLLAYAIQTRLDRPLAAERAGPLAQAEELLRTMRVNGLNEDELRSFIARFSGDDWEDFYEELFGYEAKLAARARLEQEETGRKRRRYAAWRDPLVRRIDAVLLARCQQRERVLLQKVEERGLTAQGVNLVTARRKARRSAEALVTAAAEIRAAARSHGEVSLNIGRAIREAATRPEETLDRHETGLLESRKNRFDLILGPLLGPRARFVIGTVLLGGCLLWIHQNGIVNREHVQQIKQIASQLRDVRDLEKAQQVALAGGQEIAEKIDLTRTTKPLRLTGVPDRLTRLFDGFGPGVAGLVLLLSSCFRGVRMSLFAVPAALIATLGPRLGLPDLGPLPADQAAMALAAALAVLGWFLGRTRT